MKIEKLINDCIWCARKKKKINTTVVNGPLEPENTFQRLLFLFAYWHLLDSNRASFFAKLPWCVCRKTEQKELVIKIDE